MQFTYTYLKNADQNKMVVGHYNNLPVIPAIRDRLAEVEDLNHIFLIYDDNNLLYYNGYVFASVDKSGNVTEFNRRRYVVKVPQRAESVAPAAEVKEDTSSSGDQDVMLTGMVEDTLKQARELTIDQLLIGFRYGL